MGKETQGLWVCLSLLVVLSAVLTWDGWALVSEKIALPTCVSKTPSRETCYIGSSLTMKAPFRSTRADLKSYQLLHWSWSKRFGFLYVFSRSMVSWHYRDRGKG